MAARDVKDADVPSKITGRALDEIRKEYGIPTTIKLFSPNPHQRVNHEEGLRIAIHEEMLRIGIKFPFEGLMSSFLATFKVTPGQMTPNSWRIIREISMWAEDNEIQISGNALLHLLTLKRSGDFVVVQGLGNSKVVTGMPTSNKGWKSGFFFAKRVNGREEFIQWNVPYKWRSDLVLPSAEPLSEEDAEALEALKIVIGSQGLPYTLPHRIREKTATTPKRPRSRGSLRKASGEPLAIEPLRTRAPDGASPLKKRRKTAEEQREDEELEAALRDSALMHVDDCARTSEEEQLRLALIESAEVGIILSSGDEAPIVHLSPEQISPA